MNRYHWPEWCLRVDTTPNRPGILRVVHINGVVGSGYTIKDCLDAIASQLPETAARVVRDTPATMQAWRGDLA
jgi:hypothetical protein